MPRDAGDTEEEERTKAKAKYVRSRAPTDNLTWQWWRLPTPVKRVFDRFPLQTYGANEVPQRTRTSRNRHTLYVFATDAGARSGAPSFNPGCLKWQTYLRFQDIDFQCSSSSNHASPTGALPFLLPATESLEFSAPISSGRIRRWVSDRKTLKESNKSGGVSLSAAKASQEYDKESWAEVNQSGDMDVRYDAYMTLIDHRIRNAYLYSLYLSPLNFNSVAFVLYIEPTTTNYLVRLTLSHQLRAAAEAELLKQANVIDVQSLHREGEKAFSALSTLLGQEEYFFGEKRPTLLDASVFAYTNILLDEDLHWQVRHLQESLERHENLVIHRDRIRERFYGASP